MLSKNTTHGPKRGASLQVALALISLSMAMMALGCCPDPETPPAPDPPPASHTMVFAIDPDTGDNCNCVQVVPEVLGVEHGDMVWFVNVTPYTVTITPSVAGSFGDDDEVALPSKTSSLVTVSDQITPGQVTLNLEIAGLDQLCGLPGPRMDVDD
ncbi:MAG: hypothetical protein GY906_09170 [bacterium]|nr:hypothetical protein [bacterium]